MKKQLFFTIIFLISNFLLYAISYPEEFKNLYINDYDISESFIFISHKENTLNVYQLSGDNYKKIKEITILNDLSLRSHWLNLNGLYEITEWLTAETISEENSYGTLSLNIPDKLDKYLQKNINPIYIKSISDSLMTECDLNDIFINNSDMKFLFDFFEMNSTPIIISDVLKLTPFSSIEEKTAQFINTLESWKKSWEEQNIDIYMQYYHNDFFSKSGNMDLDRWYNHKRRIFNINQSVKVNFTNAEFIFKDNFVYFEALQEYNSNNYSDFGRKIIIWKYENNAWTIWAEDWHKTSRPEVVEEVIKPELPVEEIIIVQPVVDSVRIKWEKNNGKFPFEYINFVFPKLQNYDDKLIVVQKIDQTAALYKIKDDFKKIELYRTYTISSGQNQGNKWRRGDLKTPEGLYITQKFIPDEELAPKYGTGAFTLDYPNQLDRILRKTGYGIWLHGSDIDMIPYDTEGCVRFENHEITYFREVLNLENTPVIINDKISWYEYNELQNEVKTILDLVKDWKDSWKNQDFESYIDFYTSDFHTRRQSMNYEQWYEHKKRIFNPENKIEINLFDFDYYYADGYILISFYQDYKSGNYTDFGRKQLVLKRNDNLWKIYREEWSPASRRLNVKN